MEKYVPEIQDEVRRQGYPLNESKRVQEFIFGSQSDRWHWEFVSKDRTQSVVLNEEFVVLQTTAYGDFETFLAQLTDVVEMLNSRVGGLYVTRLGLRYVNVVMPRLGETWREYVQPGLRGFDSDIFEPQVLRLHQTVATTRAGAMVVRVHQNDKGLVVPPDFVQTVLKIPAKFSSPDKLVTLIDIDHFHAREPLEYERAWLEEIGWQLKEGSYEVFADQIVTPHALEVWK